MVRHERDARARGIGACVAVVRKTRSRCGRYLDDAIALPETIYRICFAMADGKTPEARDVAAINVCARSRTRTARSGISREDFRTQHGSRRTQPGGPARTCAVVGR